MSKLSSKVLTYQMQVSTSVERLFILTVRLRQPMSQLVVPLCSGLAAAYRLQKEGARVAVFDSNGVGGTIQSYSKDGYIWERGANTMVS